MRRVDVPFGGGGAGIPGLYGNFKGKPARYIGGVQKSPVVSAHVSRNIAGLCATYVGLVKKK